MSYSNGMAVILGWALIIYGLLLGIAWLQHRPKRNRFVTPDKVAERHRKIAERAYKQSYNREWI